MTLRNYGIMRQINWNTRSGVAGLCVRAELRDCDSLNINQSPLCQINTRRAGEETEYQERVAQWYRAAAQKVKLDGWNGIIILALTVK